MECTVVFRCPCNDKAYPSQTALKAHQKTKAHKAWETSNELRELKIALTEKDNTIVALNQSIATLRDLNAMLLKRISMEMSS